MIGCTRPRIAALFMGAALFAVTGCHHRSKHRPIADELPPVVYDDAPVSVYTPPSQSHSKQKRAPMTRIPVTPIPDGGVSREDLDFIASHRPIRTETGLASWYRAPYKGRRSANGQVFDDHALTAAHRTLPMGSLIVVTNLKTGQSSAMRISDRGPFVEDRVVDLTVASARATGVYLPGSARVRIDVYQTPKPINIGGRWCVQIGAFSNERDAIRLKQQLQSRYPTASVIEFPGDKSFWVRIRPEGDDRSVSMYLAEHLKPVEGKAYLTRLD